MNYIDSVEADSEHKRPEDIKLASELQVKIDADRISQAAQEAARVEAAWGARARLFEEDRLEAIKRTQAIEDMAAYTLAKYIEASEETKREEAWRIQAIEQEFIRKKPRTEDELREEARRLEAIKETERKQAWHVRHEAATLIITAIKVRGVQYWAAKYLEETKREEVRRIEASEEARREEDVNLVRHPHLSEDEEIAWEARREEERRLDDLYEIISRARYTRGE